MELVPNARGWDRRINRGIELWLIPAGFNPAARSPAHGNLVQLHANMRYQAGVWHKQTATMISIEQASELYHVKLLTQTDVHVQI